MADIITILLAYTSIVLTIVGGILGFLLYHFIPVKTKVETMWRELYGGDTGDGHIAESEEDKESLRDLVEQTHSQHGRLEARMERIVRYLEDLSEHLDDRAPHIFEDNYIDRTENDFYRGGQDDD